MHIEDMIQELERVLQDVINENRVYRTTQAWLTILRDFYLSDKKKFSESQLQFLQRVRTIIPRLKRFIDLQEELNDDLGLLEYNQALDELQTFVVDFKGLAVGKRAQKEIRQLYERKPEVLEHEETRRNAKLTNRILSLEENAPPCPRSPKHRLQIRQSKNGYFWGCSAFPSCWYTRQLSGVELTRIEAE